MEELDQAWLKVKQIAGRWRIVRKSNNVTGLQGIRDDLSDFLLDVGFLESKINHIFIQAEQDRKECIEDAIERIRNEEKMSVELMKNRANIECREFLRKERSSEGAYKSVRTLTARSDQILHSVSSAIKAILKID